MWVKIDDRFAEHPKLMAAGALAWGVWAEAMAYCNRNLTDGFIPVAVAEAFGGRWRTRVDGRVWQAFVHCGDEMVAVDAEFVASALVDAGLWHRVDGGYQVHDYADYQPTKAQTVAAREQRQATSAAGGRAKAAKRAAEIMPHGRATADERQTNGMPEACRDAAETLPEACSNSAPVSRVPIPKEAADVAGAPTHTREAPPAEPPRRARDTSSTNANDLRPHPMPVKAPRPPQPGDTTIRDRADALVQGMPAADVLRPLAEAAIEITGYDVGVHTLAQWLAGGYTVERVRVGCAFAVQKYVGQCVPEGVVINTASRWMQRARPDEYQRVRTPLAIVPTPPVAPERVGTPEEQAEIMRQLDELTLKLSEPSAASAGGR